MLKIDKLLLFTAVLFSFVAVLATPASANNTDESDPYAKFGRYTEDSDWEINHSAWDEVLTSTVVLVPSSTRRMASIPHKPKTGTKISRGSKTPARFESNRVVFHLLDKGHLERVAKYRQELQILPDYYPLAEFNRDEQLAYWLNLYNVVLYEELAKRYPISKLKKLRYGDRKNPSLWDQKLVTVEGMALSLNDIQNNILIRHWQSPMVLYGLFQGAIGGPSLSGRAFTAKNVHEILRRKAKEFINSNRGFRGQNVSLVYKWGKTAFPNWETDLVRHLLNFAVPKYQSNLRDSGPLSADLYDWAIVDVLGGTLSAGPIDSTAANLLNLSHPGRAADGTLSRGHNIMNDLFRSGMIARGGFNQYTLDLMGEVARIYEEMPEREGIIFSEECGIDSCPEEDTPPPETDPNGN